MGMAGRKTALVFWLGLTLMVSPAAAATDYHSGIWNLLRAAHFNFADNGDSRAYREGVIKTGGKRYEIWRYAWEETPEHMRGSTPHGHYNILIFEQTKHGLSFFWLL